MKNPLKYRSKDVNAFFSSKGPITGEALDRLVRLPREFYSRHTLDVCPDLLGLLLVHEAGNEAGSNTCNGSDTRNGTLTGGETCNGPLACLLYTSRFLSLMALLIAILLNRSIRLKNLIRTLFIVPWVSMAVAVGLTWTWIFNSQFGLLNEILLKLGLERIPWLAHPDWAIN